MSSKEIDINEVYKKDANLKKEDVKALQEWATLQAHLPRITELQLALFLQSCYYSNELTKTTVDIYFTVKTLCPDIFGNRNPSDPSLQTAMNCVLMYPLPQLLSSGDKVILVKMVNPNPDYFNYSNQCKCFDMMLTFHLHQNGPAEGIVVLFDLSSIVFAHFLKLSVVVMKKFLYYIQEGMPIRLKSIQYFNVVSFMDKILALMKPFMKKELYDSIVIHNNMQSLYKHIPQELLPQDYGGNCESTDILHEKYKAMLNGNEEFFQFQESQVVDESKRLGKPKNVSDIFGMEGTFKKLEVD